MAKVAKSELHSTTNGETVFSLCTFCNNSTNGFDKKLFATEQPKGPFFPVLAELDGSKAKLDLLGRAVVCVACFHHLLRQWSSFERRGIPVRKREYNIITDDRVNNYQARREEEIRREAEHKIKEIQDREERIRQEAEQRFETYRQRQADIRREAENKLLEEHSRTEQLKKETETKLKAEQQKEDELRRQAEERILEEKEKREYIRQEAERLLREEKLLDADRRKQEYQPARSEETEQESQPVNLEIVTKYRTEVIIPAVESRKENYPLKEIASQESDGMAGVITEKELSARSKSRKMMVFDPETGCYRKKSDVEDEEGTTTEIKTERVEYRFRLRSDEKRGIPTEMKDSSSTPDKTSEDIQVSMTNGKNKTRKEEGDEEDLKRAGDALKAKFEEDRMKFEEEPVQRKKSDPSRQRTTRATSDESLEEKIREMEKRRERLLLRGPSFELEKRRDSDEKKEQSPRDEPESPRSSSDDTGKKQRSRKERNKRRLTAEELSKKKSLGSEEDLTEERSQPSSDAAKVPKTETKKETFTMQLSRDEKHDDVFVVQEKPVEAGPGDLMSWDDDSTDGRSVPEKDSPVAFRKRADSTEGETFPKSVKLVEIEAPITVTQKEKVQSAPVDILDLHDEDQNMSSPVFESISTWESKTRVSDTAEEDRRRREKEHEERKRRIEENQRRAAQELKTKKQSSSDVNETPRNVEPVREMTMKEKRRSLVDMWESFSEPQTNVMSFEEDVEEHPPKRSSKVLVRDNRTISFDPAEENGDEEVMEVDEEEKISSSRPVVDRNENLSEQEQRWENAGNFQPGRLQKTVFHSLSESAPTNEESITTQRKGLSRYEWMKGESFADQEALVPSKLKLDWQSNQATEEIPRKTPTKPSSIEPVQVDIKTDSGDTKSSSEESESSSESESESEEDRKPRVDTDEYHKLTEEEKQWEAAGHFQPKKLNIALMASFQQAPVEDAGPKPAPRKTQEISIPQKVPQESPKKESAPSKPERGVIKVEEINPVNEVKTETEPYTSGTYTYEEESDSDDDIPGWRKVEEQRRQQEREEIERAKLEEKRRMEREAMEEDENEETDSSDDEFEAKVRTKEIRRINQNLLVQFMKEPDKEPEKPVQVPKPKEQKIEVASVQTIESAPSPDSEDEEEDRCVRTVEDEYEERVKSRQIGKLKFDNSRFLQGREDDQRDTQRGPRVVLQEERLIQNVEQKVVESAPSRDLDVGSGYTNEPEINAQDSSEEESEEDDGVPEWRKVEEKRRQQEQAEVERAKLEEQRRREREASESDEEDSDSDDDEFEAKVRTKEIRKINPNLLFQFMGEPSEKENPPSPKKQEKEPIEIQQAPAEDTSSSDNSDAEDKNEKIPDGEEDEFEIKVKSGQVRKLVLNNSPFAQTTTSEEPRVMQRRPEAKQKVPEPIVQEEAFFQVVDDKVVESEPDIMFQEPREDDVYEEKVKSRLVKRLSQDQFGFLRKQEEEERRKAQEEERRRAEREEREKLRKEEERRRRMEAQARAQEEERLRKEEEVRRREEEERARKEEERRRKTEEAERLRQEEEERLRREEEEEKMRLEEMRRQKQEAKKKFESGVFDDVAVNHTEKDIYSVGRLDSNMFLQFQSSAPEEPKLKSKSRDKEKFVEEKKVPELEAETVVMTSVDVIESSPYDERFDLGPSEDLEYEEKRKSVGKLDKDWYTKQQLIQAEEQSRRARELEEQRLREEKNEMLRIRQDSSKQLDVEEPDNGTRDSEKKGNKLSVDKLSRFEKDAKEKPKESRKKKDKSSKVQKREEVQAAPIGYDDSRQIEKRKSVTSEDGSIVILARDDDKTAQQKMRLQREREESDLLRLEEERRRLASQEESYAADDVYSDKPNFVGKLNQQQFSMFQQETPAGPNLKTRKQAPQKVEEVISVKSQEDVESFPVDVGPSGTQEDAEYEQRINKAKSLDVGKFMSSRSQEAIEREQRTKTVAKERVRQEQEELATLKAEEKKRRKRDSELLDDDYLDESASVQQKSVPIKETDAERSKEYGFDKKVSVGRLPQELRSTFEGDSSRADSSPRKSSKSKGSKSSLSSSNDSLSYPSHDADMNGSFSPREEESAKRKSIDRDDSIRDAQLGDRPIDSWTPEEKPVPKKLHTSMLAAFQKSDREPEVKLRRAKSEKQVRPKSVGNVDLLRWQDDASIRSSSATSKKGKTGKQSRPKSIAF